ncbi:hypothetical protein G6F70_002688 [Rhizopus microsporus]|uniref:Gag1-like clamp domain-containing protein n=2 Tax=Rhizopus TaxID=4842 RepID=A0A367JP54_RHIAZ|nr:hypothetical protein G6F71_002704 [Rhizopus microsporus]RCH91724.1 hypothetical protein CU097_007571 [Rhizopus azygosporus]KAG1201981.1 hypothetical protein G6F70_002688 [Rhizopus microsporus]KAG1213856.1 hypothetical protein G6F69_002473 [Rhizopus microsporus]KAG1237588.1 hypothetical protein G6F67_001123 [Rhizopus microsporus]
MSGLEAWEARRKQWTTPNADVNVEEYIQELNKKQYQDLEDPKKRLGIYKQLIQQHQTFTHPVPLRFIIPILVTGWQEDGTWPKGMIVKETSD